MSCHIGPNTNFEQWAIGRQPSRSFEEANLFPEQGKHRIYNPSHRFSLYNIYFIFRIVHLCVGVLKVHLGPLVGFGVWMTKRLKSYWLLLSVKQEKCLINYIEIIHCSRHMLWLWWLHICVCHMTREVIK
jgi:hypothetical protein